MKKKLFTSKEQELAKKSFDKRPAYHVDDLLLESAARVKAIIEREEREEREQQEYVIYRKNS